MGRVGACSRAGRTGRDRCGADRLVPGPARPLQMSAQHRAGRTPAARREREGSQTRAARAPLGRAREEDLMEPPEDRTFRDELRAWLSANVDDDMRAAAALPGGHPLRVEASRSWQRTLHAAGWVAPGYPSA